MYLLRLLIVGDTGVGKTSLLIRFHEGQFIVHQKTTIGVDYKAKEVEIDGENVKLQIWDTAGQERFKSMTAAFYNKGHGIILVFDVSLEESFRSLPAWIRDIKRDAPRDCEIVLCANKTDLPVEMWEVSREQFTLFAQENNLPVFETSASSGSNVEEVFKAVAQLVFDNNRGGLAELRESESQDSAVVFDLPSKKKSSKCC
mmetsp:Transcript_14909/g.22430  ORF Transcript_14909/g.22430 Transcript_14909/m.22430 type:complete len:201 (-) Transcript_14909:117-719(-)